MRPTLTGTLALCATLMLGGNALGAQASRQVQLTDSVRTVIEAAVDGANVTALDASVQLAERALAAYPNDGLLQHYRAYALYRAGSLVFGQSGSGKARPYFETARGILEVLVKQPTIPETYALLASVYGMQIATARVQMLAGMQLGAKSNEWMERGVVAGPQNPRVWVMRGIGALNTPSAFGGGADKAEAHLKKALELFNADAPAVPLPAWGKPDAYIWLGQAYQKQKKLPEARAAYQMALTLQPQNQWVSATLLPSLDRK